jgi:predicted metal-dependent phosphoesterase TrpH
LVERFNMDSMLRADFHLHTKYSMDSSSSLEDIIKRCQETGINCIAVTDHGAFEGALRMKEIAPFTIIPGEEILTPNGEVIGYFLKELIPSKQPIEAVIKAIRAQGGLVGLPHPFDTFRGLKNLDNQQLEELAAQVDVVEVFNARSLLPGDSDRAREFAARHNLPATAGSDAHSIREIGKTYVEMPPFDDPHSFLTSLSASSIQRRRASPFVHAYTMLAKVKNVF